MDSETQKVYSEGEDVANFVAGRGWNVAKQILENKILDLQSIKNLTGISPAEVVEEIKVRNTVVDVLTEIIREVEGRALQHTSNIPLMDDKVRII